MRDARCYRVIGCAMPGVTGWCVARCPVLQGGVMRDARCYRVVCCATPGVTGWCDARRPVLQGVMGSRRTAKSCIALLQCTYQKVPHTVLYYTYLVQKHWVSPAAFEPGKCPITNFYHKPWFLFGLAVRGLGTSAKRFGAEDSGFRVLLLARHCVCFRLCVQDIDRIL